MERSDGLLPVYGFSDQDLSAVVKVDLIDAVPCLLLIITNASKDPNGGKCISLNARDMSLNNGLSCP